MDPNSLNGFMSLFTVFIGVIALYSAITGKGPIFTNDYPKSMREDANKMLRRFCWYIGPVTVVTGGLDYFWARIVGEEVAAGRTVLSQLPFLLSLVLVVPAVVVYIVIFRKRFKEQLKKKP